MDIQRAEQKTRNQRNLVSSRVTSADGRSSWMNHFDIRYTLGLFLGMLISVMAPLVTIGTANALGIGSQPHVATTSDWPMYLHDTSHTSASPDTTVTTANAPFLTPQWTFKTGGVIASSATVVSGVVYIGSWDGYEYALNATTGALIWKTFLGQTTSSNCNPSTLGVTSTASVVNGVVYVLGGDANFYALNATTGAVLWTYLLGDNSPTGGLYNWSSPLILNGSAYIGLASNCDIPLIVGKFLQINLTTHVLVNSLQTVLTGHVGGSIWSTPAYDATSNTIYLSTGNADSGYGQSIVAVDPTSLSVKGSWQVPAAQFASPDNDFGASPTLFTDSNGRQLVGAPSKNGIFYALNRTNLAAGPVWQDQIAIGGPSPDLGDGSISAASFDGSTLYEGGGNTLIGGVSYSGSVRAINPATGAYLWEHGAPGYVLSATDYIDNTVIEAAGNVLEVLNAATGASIFTYQTAGIYAAPSIAEGMVFAGAVDGTLYAFAPTIPPTPPADANCPTGWACQDIGAPTTSGSESISGSVWSVASGGYGIGGSSDQFRLIAQNATGPVQILAQVSSMIGSATGQAGVMLRQRVDAGSPFVAALISGTTLTVSYRTAFNGVTTTATSLSTTTLPRWLLMQHSGNNFVVATSTDGVTFTLVPGSFVTMIMPTTILAGIATSSGSTTAGAMESAAYTGVAIGPPTTVTTATQSASCPGGWSCADIGLPALTGTESFDATSRQWTQSGAGNDIWGTSDQFHYDWQSLAGDGVVTAQVLTQTNTSAYAKAGVMMRASTDPGAMYYGIFLTPANGIEIQYRSAQGGSAQQLLSYAGGTPADLRIVRNSQTYSAYTSTDGFTYTFITGSSLTLSTTGSVLAGIAITSHNAGALSTATYAGVSVSTSAPPPPAPTCPSSWTCQDIGVPSPAGSESYNSTTGVWSVSGGGNDIWSNYDQFRFEYQSINSDGALSAEVTSQTNTSPYAKGGVMFRATTDPGSAYYLAAISPNNGILIQYRATAGGYAQNAANPSGVVPVYLRVARTGGTNFSTYTSTDGVTWTLVPGSTVTIAMTGTILAGLAVTSHDNGVASAVSFASVTLAAITCPSGWTCQDIGAPSPAGSENYNSTTGAWTVTAGGSDIWGTADHFRYEYQTLSGDGTLSAQVTSQTNTSPYAKAGVMFRATADLASSYYFAAITPANGVLIQYRAVAGGSATQATSASGTVPIYLRVVRSGGTGFSAYTSSDGVTWTLVPGSTVTIAMSGAVLAGLAVTSHANGTPSTAGFAAVSLATTVPPPPPSACPSGWTCQDIGAPSPVGSESYNASTGAWTVTGGGSDIWGTADSFRYEYQTLSGDGTLSAQVTSQTNTSPYAKAGVMIRANSDQASAFYIVAITPTNGVLIQYRAVAGGSATQATSAAGTVPIYLRVVRSGGTGFTAYTSSDGVTWTLVPGSTVTIAMSGAVLAGLAVTSHANGTPSTAGFAAVGLATTVPPPPPSTCPAGWTCQDIGNPTPASSESYNSTTGTWTVNAAGSDIWGTADHFRYEYQTIAADATLSTQVVSLTNTNTYAKAGVMFRATTDPGSAFYLAAVSPGAGILIQYRSAAGIQAQQAIAIAGTAPAYLRVVRSGTTSYSAFTSTDGVTWTLVPGSTVTIQMTGSLLGGLALTSHASGTLCTATFKGVTLTSP